MQDMIQLLAQELDKQPQHVANVVRLLGLCREAEPHYMVLEYVDLVGG